MDIRAIAVNKRILAAVVAAVLWALFAAPLLHAHGTRIELSVDGQTLRMQALFDTGEPMSAAQIVVYAADNPRQAWHSGVADEEGNYSFTVDKAIQGQWAISVRTAGHGEILYFDVSPDGVIDVTQRSGRTPLQTGLLAGGVLAVLGSIAWYFSRSGKKSG